MYYILTKQIGNGQESPFGQAFIQNPQISSGIFGTQPTPSSPFGGASLAPNPSTTGSIFGGIPSASSSTFGNTPPRATQPVPGGLFGASSPPQSGSFFSFSTPSTPDPFTSPSYPPGESSTKAEELDSVATDSTRDSFPGLSFKKLTPSSEIRNSNGCLCKTHDACLSSLRGHVERKLQRGPNSSI